MEKVYQITACVYEEYDHNNSDTSIGIFTDKEVAKSILSKLNIDKENTIDELNVKMEDFELKNPTFQERQQHSDYDEYIESHYQIQELKKTSYHVQEFIINKLYR